MILTKKYLDDLTYTVTGCAIEVHKTVGPGLLESVYEKCFIRELYLNGIEYKNQILVPLEYKGILLDTNLRADVLIEDVIVVELKANETLLPIHDAILLTYMRMLKKAKGILINFQCVNLYKQGQKTLVNDLYKMLPDQ